MGCHASANLELAIPGYQGPIEDPTANNAATRGTHMHEIMAEIMQLKPTDARKFSEAAVYMSELAARRRFTRLVEEEMTADWLVSTPKTTADLVLFTKDEMHVVDLKTGKIPVDPVENKQLMYYGATYGHMAPKAKGIHLHIVQPWAGIMDSWFADTARIAQFMVDARAAEAAILAGDTTFSPGDHCTFCPANPHTRVAKGHPVCPAMQELLYPRLMNESDILEGM